MILGDYLDCNQKRKGTGKIACEVPDGVPNGFYLVPKSWRLDPSTDDFNTAAIKAQVKKKSMVPFLDAINYTQNNEEDVIFTTQTGVQLLSRNGKPFFSFDFDNGYQWHTAAYSYKSFGAYDVVPVYDNGVVFLAKTNDGKYKGHTAGLVNPQTFKNKDGQNPSMTTFGLQLTNPEEYNTSGVLLDPVANSFDVDAVPGIVDINIEHVSNSTADVVVKVTMGSNGAIPVLGLTDTDFRALGTAIAIDSVAYDSATGNYTITFASDVSGDYSGLVIETFDTDDSTKVVDISGVLYEGASPAAA
ncbi:MAG: hypothetical protein CMD31_00180 [Flavobacteriales bacterium]|nr:hypothetical protein [Flavobacteriales bacterium]|tara:strand:- start:2070 stop:2975 length:906 start_codon:yes stop_codon:yes gene_type:complete